MKPHTIRFHKVIRYSTQEEAKDQLLQLVKNIETEYFAHFNENLFPDSIPIRSLTHDDILEIRSRCSKK